MDSFRSVALEDRAVLEPEILSWEPCSCEMNFLNIYTWANSYGTRWRIQDGFPVIWFPVGEIVLFPGGTNPEKMPPVSLLRTIANELHSAGHPVFFNQVPGQYLELHPEYREFFRAEQVAEEYGEYIYSVQRLIELKGSKLGKKRNLIAQFKRLYPDYEVKPFTPDQLPFCRELECRWSSAHERNGTELQEEDSIRKSFDSFGSLDMEGICLYAGGRLAAFSFWSRLNSDTCDEHYEKADPFFKGCSQMLNHETMLAMARKYKFVNREQDLGIEGLRHSKKSYCPESVLRNWNLFLNGGGLR